MSAIGTDMMGRFELAARWAFDQTWDRQFIMRSAFCFSRFGNSSLLNSHESHLLLIVLFVIFECSQSGINFGGFGFLIIRFRHDFPTFPFRIRL